jgi:glycosyltransferase involved in cell wall biosynthesis
VNRRVVIVQEFLTHYRIEFFAQLRDRLAARGVQLDLVVGAADAERSRRADAAELPWAVQVRPRHLRLPGAGTTLVWLPAWRRCRGAELVVVEQGSRHVLNYLLFATRRLHGPRVAFWGHGRNRQSRRPNGVKERWKRWWLRAPDWWFAYTKSVADEVVAAGYPGDRVTVVQNSIRPAVGDEVPAPARIAGRCIFLGSLYDDKRLDVLVEAGDEVARRVPEFALDIVGAGPGADFLAGAARTRPWLTLVGPLRDADLAARLTSAQLLLLPGLVGLAVIEGFAARTPVVTMQWEHHSPEFDYLGDGVNARVLPLGTTAADFGAAVADLLADPVALEHLRDGCRLAAATYTLDAMVDNVAAGVLAALDA